MGGQGSLRSTRSKGIVLFYEVLELKSAKSNYLFEEHGSGPLKVLHDLKLIRNESE